MGSMSPSMSNKKTSEKEVQTVPDKGAPPDEMQIRNACEREWKARMDGLKTSLEKKMKELKEMAENAKLSHQAALSQVEEETKRADKATRDLRKNLLTMEKMMKRSGKG